MKQQRLTASEVEAAARHLTGDAAPARLLEEKDRNQVFRVGEQAIFKAYLADGSAKQARKIAALEFLAGHGLPVPALLGHGIVAKGNSGVPWTLETRVAADHIRPSHHELDTPWGWELHRALGRWLPNLHAFGGFPSFGTWQADGPATLARRVLPRASIIRAQAAELDNVPPALVRRAIRGLDRLEPAIRDARRLRPRLLHGDYGTSNAVASPASDRGMEVVAVFDFESAAPGDPVEDFLWTADHGLDSRIFQSFLGGYLENGQLDLGAPERFAFYQLEHCLGLLGWTPHADPEYFAQAQWLIEQVLDGARLQLP
jgi:aminoglycoside phosphotransferase (APT) family kinase protein